MLLPLALLTITPMAGPTGMAGPRDPVRPAHHAAGLLPAGGAAERALLMADLERRVGELAWENIMARDGGAAFLDELGGDEAWLRDLMDSGPVRKPDVVLDFLLRLWTEDPELSARPVDRGMATACALTMGMKKVDGDTMAARYGYYRDSYAEGLLNVGYGDLATWERRFLAHGCQWGSLAEVASLEYLRDRICWPRAQYVDACWQAPYRSYNCLADSVQRADYYMPFIGAFSCRPEMTIEVGGVCGALSNLGASAAMANGIPAATMGEPGHCAYTVKIDAATWKPAYTVSWKRSLHTSFHGASWPGLMLTEACFSDDRAVHRAGDLAREAHALESAGEIDRADRAWERALAAHGLHYGLWLERAAFGKRTNRDASWWRAYQRDLLDGLEDHEEPAWNLLTKKVYPELLEDMDSADRRHLFLAWIRGLDTWGGGRWNIEGAWTWIFKQIETSDQERLSTAMTSRLLQSSTLGPSCVAWLLNRVEPGTEGWEASLENILHATRSSKGATDATLKDLARKMIPEAAERGDVDTFQAIGRAAARLAEAQPMDGLEPFPGDLASDGGLLIVSGKGNRWDSPEHHWGVLGEHGGHCHTDNGASFITVRLERFVELTGLVIQNRAGGYMSRANGCRIEISSDGETWEQIGTLQGALAVYRIDLAGQNRRCSWVRIAKDTNCLHLRRFLVYGYRRS